MANSRLFVEKLNDEFTLKDVGSSLLQDLARGLYHRHEVIREYVQNAVDAHRLFEHQHGTEPGGPIQIEVSTNKVSFLDRGVGMSEKEIRKVKSIAISKKQNADVPLTGHKGVGIWAGLSYFDTLTVLTSAFGDSCAYELIIRFRRIAESISDDASIDQVLNNNYEIKVYEEDPNKHYTDVSLEGPYGPAREWFLDADKIRDAIRRYCPCQLDPTFGLYSELTQWYHDHKIQFYDIKVDGQTVYRSYPSSVEDFRQDTISIDDQPVAYYWHAIHKENGILEPREDQLLAFRIVQNGFVLGGDNLYSEEMQDYDRLKLENYLKWYIGEIHVTAPDLRPDLQRRRFEESERTRQFIKRCRRIYQNFAESARRISPLRSRQREYKGYEDEINDFGQNAAPLNLSPEDRSRVFAIRAILQEHDERVRQHKPKKGQNADEKIAALRGTTGERKRVLDKIGKLLQVAPPAPPYHARADENPNATAGSSNNRPQTHTEPATSESVPKTTGNYTSDANKSARNGASSTAAPPAHASTEAKGSGDVATSSLVLVDVFWGLLREVLREELPENAEITNRIIFKLRVRLSSLVDNVE